MTVETIGAAGDRATVTLWEANIPDPLTEDHFGEHLDEESVISTDVILATDTDTFLLKLMPQAGAKHDGTFGAASHVAGDGARISMGASDSLTLQEGSGGTLNTVEISDLVLDIAGTNNGVTCSNGADTGYFLIQRNIIKGDANSSWGISWSHNCETVVIRNNLIYDITASNGILNGNLNTGCEIHITNNTIINCNEGIVQDDNTVNGSVNLTIKNNLLQGNITNDYRNDDTAGYTLTTAKNVTEDATSPDGSPYVSVDMHTTNDVFVDYANDNFLLDSGGHAGNLAILDDGDDLSAIGSPEQFSDDIQDQTRSTWYIGASEIVLVGGVTIPLMAHHYTKNIESRG